MKQERSLLFLPPEGGRVREGVLSATIPVESTPSLPSPPWVEGINSELTLLLHGIRQRYGYDFSHYSPSSLQRRLTQLCATHRITRYTELLDRVFHDAVLFEQLLQHLSITVTGLFRDPPFWRSLREHIVPHLKTFPFIKIWHAGCATGEEAYSMAILLHEEGFLNRAHIYATDFNRQALDQAQRAVYPAERLPAWRDDYQAGGGTQDFARYYHCGYQLAKFREQLKERITFSYHNLVTDGVFGEMNLILCRNVLIYFDRQLQRHVHSLFAQSLRHDGILCLGAKETLQFTTLAQQFEAVDARCKIYRKCKARHV